MSNTNDSDISSKVWFITGASRGLGAQIARAVLVSGDSVVAAVRDPANTELAAHPRLQLVALDVRDERAAQAAVRAAVERFGRIDVVVNNAGYGLLAAVEEGSAAEVEGMFATNVFGLLAVTRAVLPQLRAQRSGHIINISSLGGYAAYQGWGLYGATKFAVEGITEALAQEVAPLGIHATVVEPGFFRTEFLDGSSLHRSAVVIEDYEGTVGVLRTRATELNKQQPGDPRKLAAALIQLAAAKQPPLRLPLGEDAVARIEGKNAAVAAELERWRALSESTGFDA